MRTTPMPRCRVCDEWQPSSVGECSKGHGWFPGYPEALTDAGRRRARARHWRASMVPRWSAALRARLDALVLPLAAARAAFGQATPPIPTDYTEMKEYAAAILTLTSFACSGCGRSARYVDAASTLASVADRMLGGMASWLALLGAPEVDGYLHLGDVAPTPTLAPRSDDETVARQALALGLVRYRVSEGICPACLDAAATGRVRKRTTRRARRKAASGRAGEGRFPWRWVYEEVRDDK